MKPCQEEIRKYLKTVTSNNSTDGRLRDRSKGKLVLLWGIVVGLGMLASLGFKSILTAFVFITSIFFMVLGTYMFDKKDYRWHLYYCYNTCGGIIGVTNFFLGSSLQEGMVYVVQMITLFCISIFFSGIITYRLLKNMIEKGWTEKQGNRIPMTYIIGAGTGTFLASITPEELSTPIVLSIAGISIGIVVILKGITYYYGRKYDPQAELIRQVEEEAKAKAAKTGKSESKQS